MTVTTTTNVFELFVSNCSQRFSQLGVSTISLFNVICQTLLYDKCHTSSVSWGIVIFDRVSLQTETKIHRIL